MRLFLCVKQFLHSDSDGKNETSKTKLSYSAKSFGCWAIKGFSSLHVQRHYNLVRKSHGF